MNPMISAPTTGTTMTKGPRVCASGVFSAVLKRWKKNRLVKSPISFSSPSATNAPTSPMTIANALMMRSLGVAVKSPRFSAMSRSRLDMLVRAPFARLVEEHPRFVRRRLHALDDESQKRRELFARLGRQLSNRDDESFLSGAGCLRGQPPAAWCQHQLEPAGVALGRLPPDQLLRNQAADHG